MKNMLNLESKPKPLIVVDIDDVLCDLADAILRYLREQRGLDLTPEQYSEDWSKMLGVPTEQAIQVFVEFALGDYGYGNLEPIAGSYKALQRLKPKYELAVLTSRAGAFRDTTLNWLEKHFPDTFDDVYFSGIYDDVKDLRISASETKTNKLREIGAAYFIDDQPKHVKAAANVAIKSLLFGDYGWSRGAEIENSVTRAADWQGVADYFGVK